MDSLFSHASTDAPSTASAPPARVSRVTVPVPVDQAFDGFTDAIHLWWPLDTHSKFGVYAHLGFDQSTLLEEDDDGASQLWAEIESWEAPTSLTLRWYLAGDPLLPTRVKVTFTASGESGTDVELVQDGWIAGDGGVAQFEKYCDWPLILARFARFMGASVSLD